MGDKPGRRVPAAGSRRAGREGTRTAARPGSLSHRREALLPHGPGGTGAARGELAPSRPHLPAAEVPGLAARSRAADGRAPGSWIRSPVGSGVRSRGDRRAPATRNSRDGRRVTRARSGGGGGRGAAASARCHGHRALGPTAAGSGACGVAAVLPLPGWGSSGEPCPPREGAPLPPRSVGRRETRESRAGGISVTPRSGREDAPSRASDSVGRPVRRKEAFLRVSCRASPVPLQEEPPGPGARSPPPAGCRESRGDFCPGRGKEEFEALDPELYLKQMCAKNTVPSSLWKYWEILPINLVIISIVTYKQCTFRKFKFLSEQCKKLFF
ncbi:uncharacterized protein LOC113974892 [Neopelma chrysocephalum]|uniref:uncharacterized protein LOC113974892 n=1 Tax=Neopelma chrysocephalum TaxID=114329 RepID=UPI000FCD19B5|nr:uncharacterized protein LOC113974892 [Neopelma chrysocephalum]